MELLAFAVIVAAIILVIGIGRSAGRLERAFGGRLTREPDGADRGAGDEIKDEDNDERPLGALTVRGHTPPDDFIEPGEWSEPEWEWEQWNVHLPPWAREEETSFGEALVYQVAMLAAAHQRLAAAVERLGSPPTQETQVGSKP